MKSFVHVFTLAAVLMLGISPRASEAYDNTLTLDIPELVGTFVHGQEPVEALVDFGFAFQPLWSVTLDITATGHPGHEGAVAPPVDLLVSATSVEQYNVPGMTWISPTVMGPFGQASSTQQLTQPFAWVAIYPPPITSGRAYVTIDTPPSAVNDDYPSYLEITSARITAEYQYLAVPGDLDGDGFVGLGDLNIILQNWNRAGQGVAGDTDADGFVGLGDLDVVLNNWNAGTPPLSSPLDLSDPFLDCPCCLPDGDGFVGLADLDLILTHWNMTVPPADPRADCAGCEGLVPDGFVGLDDLDVILKNWNSGTPPETGVVPDAEIPGELCIGLGCGFIGLAELDRVLTNWNMDVPPGDPQADWNGDGFIGLDDLDIILKNWNTGTPPTTAVPEPAAFIGLGFGVGSLAYRRRR